MTKSRETLVWLSGGVAVFVLGTAIFTGNAGLYLLAALSAASALALLARDPRNWEG